jgi:exopolysaccharide biosynthesis protein
MRDMIEVNKCTKTKRNTSKKILLFIMFEFIFTAITAPFVLYYGPFKNVKTTVVGSAMTTLTLQWLVTSFISDEKIKQIMIEQKIESIAQDNVDSVNSGIKVENINDNTIERYDLTCKRFKGYMLVINDPFRIKVGYSSMLGKDGEPTSEIAKRNSAIAAVNGGGFSARFSEASSETGINPVGIIMSDGKVIFNNIKNEDEQIEVVALTKSGKLLVGNHTINEMKEVGVSEAVSFGPALIVNGKKVINTGDGGWGIAPRTAIAQRQDGTILLMVIDGRQINSFGATLRQVQDELFRFGAYNAANLDGGSSSTLFYKDEVINNPCDSVGERAVPSIIYVESREEGI